MPKKFTTSLAEAAPQSLLEEWHPTKNGELTPEDFGIGSKEKAWWTCRKCRESWQRAIAPRYHGNGCPYCAGKKVSAKNSLQTKFPEIAKQWDYSKNGSVQPSDVLSKSSRKFWWICPKHHSYKTQVSTRTRGRNCPICSGNKVVYENSLAGTNPELVKEWNYERNLDHKPEKIGPNSHYKAWWKCRKGHEWQATVANRNYNESGCPDCGKWRVSPEHNLLIVNPLVAAEWHPEKNHKKSPAEFTPNSGHKAWWKCKYGHTWNSTISHRNNGSGCPYCGGGVSAYEARIYAELRTVYPDTIWHTREFGTELDIFIPSIRAGVEMDGYNWHKDSVAGDKRKNRKLEKLGLTIIRVRQAPLRAIAKWDVVYSGKEPELDTIKRLVSALHSLEGNKAEKDCVDFYLAREHFADEKAYSKIVANLPSPPKEASFGSLYPDIAGGWHPTKNSPLTPEHFAPKANRKMWWKCAKGHEWQATIYTRTTGVGCPYCANKVVGEDNCLATTHPNLAKEWNDKRNQGISPKDVTFGSGRNVWWKCKKGHEWQARVGNRTRGQGCPFCSGNLYHVDNCLATTYPEVAKTWIKEKNGDVTPYDVTPGSVYRAWWTCQTCGEPWKCRISGRVRGKHGCPKCSAQARSASARLKRLKIYGTLRKNAPEIAQFWDPSQNGDLTPDDVGRNYTKNISWKCPSCGFRWECSPHKFTACPSCSKKNRQLSRHSH